jgi:hypothetical protein
MRRITSKAYSIGSTVVFNARRGLAPSLERQERENKKAHRRYILGIGIFAFAMTGLIGGSVGGLAQEASARENRIGTTLTELLSGRQQTNRPTEQTQQQAPVTTITQPPVTEQAPIETATQPTVPVVSQETVQQEAPIDTASQIALTTSAQARVVGEPVTYTSQQISTNTRDQLLLAATIGIVAGIVLLLLSLTTSGGEALAKAKSMRVRIPVREAATQ